MPPTEPTDDRKWNAHTDHARSLGTGHGTEAAEAFEITDADHARRLLAVLDIRTATPKEAAEVNASIEHDPLSGEHDHPTPQWLYSTLRVEPGYDTDGELRRAYEQAFRDAFARVLVRRARLGTGARWRNAPHGYHKIQVTLTATSNTYLSDRLPLDGELEVFEMDTFGHVQPAGAVFRERLEDGGLAAPVEVRDIAFTYTSPGAVSVARQARAERQQDPGPFVFDWQSQPDGFLRWLLPVILPEGHKPDLVQRLSEATGQFARVELTILVNGVEMNARRFIEAVEHNMRFYAAREARRMVDDFGGLQDLEDVLREVGSAARRMIAQRVTDAGIEMPDSDDHW